MSTSAQFASAISTTWPKGFDMVDPPLHGFAVREVAASADAVFSWIRRPDLHPSFYPGLRGVRKIGGAWPQLDVGSKITFTIGLTFVPMVKVAQCDPTTRSFAWVTNTPGLKVCHAFTVAPVDANRSLVRSEEQWEGLVARLGKAVVRPQLQKIQNDWVEAIVRAATAHPSGPPA